jgi:flavin reductase (DIM6/NTAB) family NADH-FMN oxidoreductase RutF
VTQTSFDPPLLAVAVKVGSGIYQNLKSSNCFALNFLGKDQQGAAFTFFKPAEVEDAMISGEAYPEGTSGSPILESAPPVLNSRSLQSWNAAIITSSLARHLKSMMQDRSKAAPMMPPCI